MAIDSENFGWVLAYVSDYDLSFLLVMDIDGVGADFMGAEVMDANLRGLECRDVGNRGYRFSRCGSSPRSLYLYLHTGNVDLEI